MKLKGVIFDLDGVIVNTVPIHFKAWKKMFGEFGIDFTFDDYQKKVDGIPRVDGAKAILTNSSDDEIKKATDLKQKYFLELLEKEEIPVFHSTVNFIKDLRNHDLKTAIISSSKNCDYILKKAGLTNLFDVQVNGNDITKGKPDPQIFQIAAKKLGLSAENSIVVEDAVLGVEAAKKAKMFCIGIDRHNNAKNLKKADVVVQDLSELDFNKVIKIFKG